MTTAVRSSYAGYRFPAGIISYAVWLYFRFPLSLRMVDELLAARGIMVSGYDELRNFLHPRSHSHQHVPANHRRLQFLRRTTTVLAILEAA